MIAQHGPFWPERDPLRRCEPGSLHGRDEGPRSSGGRLAAGLRGELDRYDGDLFPGRLIRLLLLGACLSQLGGAACAQPASPLPAITPPSSAAPIIGADPTGAVDSTVALNNAATAACGKVLDIPPGTYLTAGFTPCVNSTVKGFGVGVTTLKRLAGAVQDLGAPLVIVASGDDIENLSIDLNTPALGNWWTGIGPTGATSNVILRNLSVENASFDGVNYDYRLGAWPHSNIRLENITVTNSGWVGVAMRGITNGSAKDISVTSSGYNAIELEASSQFQLIAARADKAVSPTIIFNGAGNGQSSTSKSSNTIGTGSFNFTIGTGLTLFPGQAVYFYSRTNPADYIYGDVTSYNAKTGALLMSASASRGSGTWASWYFVPEQGMLIFRGILNRNIAIINPVVNNNIHAASDGIGMGENGTSSTANQTPNTGQFTFTGVDAGRFYLPGQNVSIFSRANPTATWMRGTVTSYSGTKLSVNITTFAGSGAHTDWQINTEPGNETITDAVVTFAGLFGIDVASGTHIVGATIDQAAARGLEIGLDFGGRLANFSVTGVKITRTNGIGGATGVGLNFGNGGGFTSFEHGNLTGVSVGDDRAVPQTQVGFEVDDTLTAFSDVHVDYASSSWTGAAHNYFAFGSGTDPRLDGQWASFVSTPVWTGGTPTGAAILAKYDDHGSGRSRGFRFQINTGNPLNGANALTLSLPAGVTLASGIPCVLSGYNASSPGAAVQGYGPVSGTTITVIEVGGFLPSQFLEISGTCELASQ